MFNAIFLRAVSINIIFPYKRDFSFVSYCTIGMVNDMYAESSNDKYKDYAQIATQKDFDVF